MTLFILTVLPYILFSALCICGFYKISRHNIIILPNETFRVEGHILKWWSEFWEATTGVTSWMYSGDQLEEKFKVLKAANPKIAAKLQVAPEKQSLVISQVLSAQKENILTKEDREFIEDYLQVRTHLNADALFLFLDEPKYRFPKWVRFPISGCPICMAGPISMGGLTWLCFVIFSGNVFSFSDHPETLKWAMWMPYCIALSFVNYVISKKIDL